MQNTRYPLMPGKWRSAVALLPFPADSRLNAIDRVIG